MKAIRKALFPLFMVCIFIVTMIPVSAASVGSRMSWEYPTSNDDDTTAYYTYMGSWSNGTTISTSAMRSDGCYSFTASKKGVYMVPAGVVVSDSVTSSGIVGCRITQNFNSSDGGRYLLFGMEAGETVYFHKASGSYEGIVSFFGTVTKFTAGFSRTLTAADFHTETHRLGFELDHYMPKDATSSYTDAHYYAVMNSGGQIPLDKVYISEKSFANGNVYFYIHALGCKHAVQARYEEGSAPSTPEKPKQESFLKRLFTNIGNFFRGIANFFRSLFGLNSVTMQEYLGYEFVD